MNSKEYMLEIFHGKGGDFIPVCPHWWGVYKFELTREAGILDETKGLIPDLSRIDSLFFETFKPDWFHLGAAEWKAVPNEAREQNKKEILKELRILESTGILEEYLRLNTYTEEEIRKTGTYDHVETIVKEYGDKVFIAMNEGNPVCEILDPDGIIGFERGLMALVEKPAFMEKLIFGLYERKINWMKVLAKTGCHGYIGSETYVSADLISPECYGNFVFPAQKYFYENVRKLGLEPIVYFCGDINPLIPFINQLDVSALLIEESKKGFHLDPRDLRKKLAPHITLFGNLDSVHTLLFGTPGDVERETLRQLEAASSGRFVMANGSPIAPGTPRENIETMIETVRKFRFSKIMN